MFALRSGIMRPSGRQSHQLRAVSFEPGAARYAEGSCLARFGDTHVLCTASWAAETPRWKRGSGEGWVTAEYGMLPRATHTRGRREAAEGRRRHLGGGRGEGDRGVYFSRISEPHQTTLRHAQTPKCPERVREEGNMSSEQYKARPKPPFDAGLRSGGGWK